MSSKNVLKPVIVLNAGDASTATLTSSSTNIQFLDDIAYQAIWTGTPTGTLTIEASLDNSNWATITTTFTSNPAGSASNSVANVPTAGYSYLRVKYTRTSGTGTLTIYVAGKGI